MSCFPCWSDFCFSVLLFLHKFSTFHACFFLKVLPVEAGVRDAAALAQKLAAAAAAVQAQNQTATSAAATTTTTAEGSAAATSSASSTAPATATAAAAASGAAAAAAAAQSAGGVSSGAVGAGGGGGGGGGKVKAAAQAAASAAKAAAKAAAAAAAASARLEPGQYKSIADALAAAEAGDTVVLGPGHHWEVAMNDVIDFFFLLQTAPYFLCSRAWVGDILYWYNSSRRWRLW